MASRKSVTQDLLFPLLDALQITVTVDPVDLSIHGTTEFSSEFVNGVTYSFVAKVLGGYVGTVTSSVLLQVLGDLWVYAFYRSESKMVSVVVLDSSKIKFNGKISTVINQKASNVLRKLKAGIVRYYTRHVDDGGWSEVNET